ncbi:DUF4913 domain-containing protein [Nonomuraea sp. NPDC046802]|uniref:DUF4913 domain-containing protein n=1 Tax=Nonomuraea sp. NPDC046802 TaxID=3154919 RepID=UPI0033FF855D
MTETPDETNGTPPWPPLQEPLDFPDLPDPSAPHQEEEQGDAPAGPEFILRLGSAEYMLEISLLTQWVDDLLIPTYLSDRIPSSTALWCPTWWEHDEAVARLHGLWFEWQQWTDPEAGGLTGPGTWHRDCLDPAMRELRAPDGPFSRCMHSPDKPVHRSAKPVAWNLPDPVEQSLFVA